MVTHVVNSLLTLSEWYPFVGSNNEFKFSARKGEMCSKEHWCLHKMSFVAVRCWMLIYSQLLVCWCWHVPAFAVTQDCIVIRPTLVYMILLNSVVSCGMKKILKAWDLRNEKWHWVLMLETPSNTPDLFLSEVLYAAWSQVVLQYSWIDIWLWMLSVHC